MSWFKKNSYVTVQVPGSKQLFVRGSWLSSSLLCKSSIHKAIKQRWGMRFHSIRWLGERRLLLYFQSKVKMMLICSPVIRSLTQKRNLLSLSWCSLACALMSWFIYNPTLIDHLIIFSSKLSVFFLVIITLFTTSIWKFVFLTVLLTARKNHCPTTLIH